MEICLYHEGSNYLEGNEYLQGDVVCFNPQDKYVMQREFEELLKDAALKILGKRQRKAVIDKLETFGKKA